MAKQKYIKLDIYKRGITIFVGTDKELKEWVKTEFTHPDYADFVKSFEDCPFGYADTHYGDGCCIVRLPHIPRTAADIAVCGHELLHATFYVLDYCGIDYIRGGANEAFTYLFELLQRETLDKQGYESIKKADTEVSADS